MRLIFPGHQTRLKLTRRLLRWRGYPRPYYFPADRWAEAMALVAVDPRKMSWNELRRHYAAAVKALSCSWYEHFLKQFYMPGWAALLSEASTTARMFKKRSVIVRSG